MSEYQTLLFSVSDGVATITLNRPDAANAINLELARELLTAVIRCDEDPAIRALLLDASGKLFCGGGDVPSFAAAGDGVGALVKEIAAYLHSAIVRLQRMDKPLVTAVQGAAAGAGLSLALAGDMVLAGEAAKFSCAYTAIGVSPDGGLSHRLPRLVGTRRATELLLTNRRLDSSQAEQWGLVNRVVADAALAQEARDLAVQLAAGPTRAFGEVKRLLADSFDQSLERQLECEASGIAAMTMSADGQEGIQAFLAKRSPTFQGH